MNRKLHTTEPTAFTCIKKLSVFILSSFIFLFSQKINAQSIGNWTFNNTLSGTPGLFNTVSSAAFSPAIPTLSFNGSTEYYGESGWPTGSVNTSSYLQFSLTPLIGYQIDINNIVLRIRRSNTGSPQGSGPTSWSLRSSLDGFTTDITTGTMTHNYANYTITPGASFINIYSTLTFRLYGYNTSVGSGGTSRFVVDNITANGVGYLLPSKLGAFSATAAADKVNLSYTIYNTEKNDLYFIERSTDGTSFNTIRTVVETDNAAEKNNRYADNISELTNVEKLYYRIHLRNSSGADTYSPIVIVRLKSSQAPLKTFIKNNQLHITGVFTVNGAYRANVYNSAGQALTQISFSAATGFNTFVFSLSRPVPPGCIIQVSNGKGYNSAVYTP